MSVAVAVVTFRRPVRLAALVETLAPQLRHVGATLVVVDNDPGGSAASVVETAKAAGVEVRYEHEPRPGIPAARNRALDATADLDLVAFTDDDVQPVGGWLAALVERQRQTGADVVTGPVRFTFPQGAPRWAEGAHCFRTRQPTAADPAAWPITSNVLLRAAALRERGVRFDESYGLAGGSDTQLFRRLGRAGATFAWADGAVVDELVPPDRATVGWALRRSYRIGNTAALCDVEERGRRGSAGPTARAAARWLWWGARAAGAAVVRRDPEAAVRAGSSLARAVGLLSALTGRRYQEYGRRPPVGGDGRRPVLVYRETLLAGSEPFITAQGEGLRGHEPWYLSLRRADGHPLPPGRDLRWRPWPVGETVRRGVWKRWGLSPSTTRTVRGVAPVLVHAHFGRDAAQVLPLVDRLGVPLVTTFHGHDATRTDADLAGGSRSDRLFLDRRPALARRGRCLAVSTAVRDRLLAIDFPPEHVELHYIGVDVDGIENAARGVQRELDLVVFAGRLVPHKGLDDLIDALARLRGRARSPRLVVVGDGPRRSAFQARARDAGIDATFLGFRSQPDTWAEMARAAVAVVPSRTGDDGWQEAFGLVAAEAQAAGTPVVATRCGGLPEAIAPSCASLLCDERDVDGLAAAIDGLLRDPAAARDRAESARAWIREHRNLAVQNRRLDAIYREVAP